MYDRRREKYALLLSLICVLLGSSTALAVLAEDFVAVRILEPPAVHPPPDCEKFLLPNHPCGAGPGFAGGISNNGDVVGILETDFPYMNSLHEMGRWLRSTNYEGENTRRFELSEGPGGLAFGVIRIRKVTSEGFAYLTGNTGNGSMTRYDIANDRWWSFGLGSARGGNNQGRGVVAESDSPNLEVEYARVVDAKLVGDEPFTNDDRGDLQRLGVGMKPQDINDADIIVGRFEGNPFKILPDGEDHWGEPIFLDEFVSFAESNIIRITDTDPPYGIGFSTGITGKRAIVWNVTSGEMIADLGGFTDLTAINSSGTMILGSRLNFGSPREHLVWWSDDGWQTFKELNAQDILVAPGGEHIRAITKLTGVNDHGQITAQGLIEGAFGQYVTPGISAWDPEIATDPNCPNSDPGEWRPGNGCGIPLLLDTMELGPGLVIGDVNNDSIVDFIDITAFINAQSAEGSEEAFLLLTPNGCFLCADINEDGFVDFIDITDFVTLLDGLSAAAVPEPSATMVFLLVGAMTYRRRRRSEQ